MTPASCVSGRFFQSFFFFKWLIRKSKLTLGQIYSEEEQSYPDTQAWIKAAWRLRGVADERGAH